MCPALTHLTIFWDHRRDASVRLPRDREWTEDAEAAFVEHDEYDAVAALANALGPFGGSEALQWIRPRPYGPIATLKYNEWVLNTYDNDLLRQYNMPLDLWYLTSQHDGSVYGFSHRNVAVPGVDDDDLFLKPLLKNQFPSPVARVRRTSCGSCEILQQACS